MQRFRLHMPELVSEGLWWSGYMLQCDLSAGVTLQVEAHHYCSHPTGPLSLTSMPPSGTQSHSVSLVPATYYAWAGHSSIQQCAGCAPVEDFHQCVIYDSDQVPGAVPGPCRCASIRHHHLPALSNMTGHAATLCTPQASIGAGRTRNSEMFQPFSAAKCAPDRH